jgi:5'-phosphate synthase pdxT subunit
MTVAGNGDLRVGVLALQGDFAAHARALAAAGAAAREVRTPAELEGLHGLVLPGGESTALLRLMAPLEMQRALSAFHLSGGAIFGTCAGLILLARKVENPEQESLGLLDVTVERNAFGRQIDSFVGKGTLSLPGEIDEEAEMVFIRAPRIRRVGPGVAVLGRLRGEPVLVGRGRILAATFHPEMSSPPAGGSAVHRYFLRLIRDAVQRGNDPNR